MNEAAVGILKAFNKYFDLEFDVVFSQGLSILAAIVTVPCMGTSKQPILDFR